MLIIPAIDLQSGRVVRTVAGDRRQVLEYPEAPLTIARRYAQSGAPWLHVVDLDGARTGAFQHLSLIEAIARAVGIPVQVGGGARSLAQVQQALDAGAARVVVGTVAVDDTAAVTRWSGSLGDRLAVGLDARAGRVLRDGWEREAAPDVTLADLARRLRDGGVARFVHTEVTRDGTLLGADLTGLRALIELGRPVLVAGGVGSYDDLRALAGAGAEGAIIGRAFLEGRLAIPDAIRVVAPGG